LRVALVNFNRFFIELGH
jgi:hypothetical protein